MTLPKSVINMFDRKNNFWTLGNITYLFEGLQADILKDSSESLHVLRPVCQHLKGFSLRWLRHIPETTNFMGKLIDSACDTKSHPAEAKSCQNNDNDENQRRTRYRKTQSVDRKAQNQGLNLEFHAEVPFEYLLNIFLPSDKLFAAFSKLSQGFIDFLDPFGVIVKQQDSVQVFNRRHRHIEQPA